MLLFNIPGCPVPWAATRVGKRSRVDPRHDEKIHITWHIKLQFQNMKIKGPLKGPVRLKIVFYMQMPHTRRLKKKNPLNPELDYPLGKPDQTNCLKLYEDMLQRAGILQNDSQVVHAEIWKFYGEKPKTVICVENVLGYPKPPEWSCP